MRNTSVLHWALLVALLGSPVGASTQITTVDREPVPPLRLLPDVVEREDEIRRSIESALTSARAVGLESFVEADAQRLTRRLRDASRLAVSERLLVLSELRREAASLAGTIQFRPATRPPPPGTKRDFGPEQATGAPDTATAGDHPTAWGTQEQDAGAEWLKLTYAKAVDVTQIRVYETSVPGVVTSVTAATDGGEVVIWSGDPVASEAPNWLELTATAAARTATITIHLDTTLQAGWNEIDAVELVGADGSRQWASEGESSTFFQSPPQGGRLGLSGPRVTDAWLAASAPKIGDVVNISLHGTSITDVGLAHLHSLEHLALLQLSSPGITGSGLKDFSGAELSYLNLVNSGVTDAGLESIAALTGIASIYLDHTGVTDAGVRHLVGMENLSTLSLRGTAITDEGLSHLRNLPALEALSLGLTDVTGSGLKGFSSAGLTSLEWRDSGVTDAGLASIAAFGQLESLFLDRTGVTDAGLRHLAGMESLTQLALQSTAITDKGVPHLRALSAMQFLNLALTDITDVAGLGELKNLIVLNLSGTRVNDAGLAGLGAFPELEVLDLSKTDVRGPGLAGFKDAKTLWFLDLNGTRVDDAGLAALVELPSLRRLEVSSTRITDATLDRFARAERLTYLDIYGTNVTADGVRRLSALKGLTELYAGGTAADDASIAALSGLSDLFHLDLQGTRVTDASLEPIGKLKNLNSLNLSGTAVTGSTISTLSGIEELRTLNLAGTGTTNEALDTIARFLVREVNANGAGGGFAWLNTLVLTDTKVSDAGLENISRLKHLFALHLNGTMVGDKGLEQIALLPDLQHLRLDGTAVSDDGLAALSTSRRLLTLSLKRTGITDEGLRRIGDPIQKLALSHTRISDAGVRLLASIEGLQVLELAGTAVTDRALESITRLPHLRLLDVSETNITDAGLEHLAVLPALAELNLNGTLVSDVGLDTVLRLRSLQRLSLEGSRVSARGASYLRHHSAQLDLELVFPWVWGKRLSYFSLADAQLPQLSNVGYLHIDESLLTQDVLRSLKDLSGLEHLSFRGTAIDDEMLKHLTGLSQVARLDLAYTRVTDVGLAHLAGLQELRELNLRGTAIRGAGLAHLAELRHLQALNLGETPLEDHGLEHLAQLRQLRKLEMGGTAVTDAGIEHLVELPHLEYVDLFGTAISDGALGHLGGMPALRFVYLSNTSLTDAGVERLGELTALEELALDGTDVTDRSVTHILSFTNLRRLRIGRTRVTAEAVRSLTKLPMLVALELDDLPVTGKDLTALQPLSTLDSLGLSGSHVSDGGLAALAEFPSLTNVDLRDTVIEPAAIDRFAAENPQLQVESGITRAGYSLWSICITVVYGLVVVAICVYGVHRYWLAWLFIRDKHTRTPPEPLGRFDELPLVTVQLPMFNERRVAGRIIESACALDYPRDRLQIQVLDDSTDDAADIARRCCERMSGRGHNIEYLHRSNREGFKGGALAAGMESATGEFIAVFDADFVPPPDILGRMIHHFTDEHIGMVQAEWSHLNRNESLLTECQAMFLDGHFVVEQSVRSRRGLWFNFNGTAGIWRNTCIEEAGGWDHDTLTEDTDLSYRAQLAGWRFLYLPTLRCDAELPSTVTAFLGQQHRWTKGLIQSAKKLLPRIMFSSASWRVKVEAWFHLTAPVMYLVMFLLTAITLPALFIETPLVHWQAASLSLGLATLILGTLAASSFYIVSQTGQGRGLLRTFVMLPALMALGIGVCAVNARAVIEAALGFRSPFVRTPKFGGRADAEPEPSRPGRRIRIPAGLVELALGGVLFACLVLSLRRPFTLIGAPFLLLFAVGYAGVGVAVLLDCFGGRRKRASAPLPAMTDRWLPSLRGVAVAGAAVLFTASVSAAMLAISSPADLEQTPHQSTALGVDLTKADWRLVTPAGDSSSTASAIKRLYSKRGSLGLDVRIDETTDEGEIMLDLDEEMRPLGDSMGSGREIVFDLEFPARFTGEFQAFARDANGHSEYGTFEIVESYEVRRTATVSLVPSNREPPMGYKDPAFNLDEGIPQIGLKISAQSDRVRGAGYRPFRGTITVTGVRVRDIDRGSRPEPEIRNPVPGDPLEPISAQKFVAGSGLDLPWPLGYGFSGPVTESHVEKLHRSYEAIGRLGYTFTRVYIGDYRTGLLLDGEGNITGVDPAFVEYVDRVADVANQHGVTVMFSLTDNTMADGRGFEGVELIADRRISQQFIDHVLVRFIGELKDRDVVWDAFNEPENVTGIPLREVQRYVDRVLEAGRAADPDARFTVVSRSRPEVVYWQGRGLDLYSHNIFTKRAVTESVSAPRRLDAPIMVAEIAPELATTENLAALRAAGYSGVGVWGWETGDKYEWQLDEVDRIAEPFASLKD